MEIKLSDFQNKVCSIPEKFDLFLGGGRGGGKSWAIAFLALRHIQQYSGKARVLFIRKSYRGLTDFEAVCREIFSGVYPNATYNAQDHIWRMPSGALLELGQLESEKDYQKYQGRSFSLLIVDEAGQYATPQLIDRLRSNLRAGRGVPVRTIIAANPGGPGHQWLAKRYVFTTAPWKPFNEAASGRKWVNVPSTYKDNEHIDQAAYLKQLEASCPSDPELLKAWVQGDWSVARGAYFASVLDEKRNAIDPVEAIPYQYRQWNASRAHMWRHWLAHDYGSSAPSVTYLMLESPGAELGGRYFPKDSILIVDEVATSDPVQLSEGLGWTIPRLAEEIKGMCDKWTVQPEGVADDACFSQHGHRAGSIADEFREYGIMFKRANKADRRTGWEKMRTLLHQAGQPDKPGLYISRHCTYFWQTVPYLGRDPRNAEDVDSRDIDHAADAVRYGLLHEGSKPLQAVLVDF